MAEIFEALKLLPVDYFTKKEAFTRTIHRGEYETIDPTSPRLSQAGNVILITGASQGIGRFGLAKQFARAKPKAIILAARNKAKLRETEEYVRTIDPSVQLLCVSTDIGSEASVKSLFSEVKREFGYANILINNAGVSKGHTMVDAMELDEWWQNFEVNVKGPLLTTKYFLCELGSAQGTVVNISSQAAWNEPEMSVGYCMSKLAIIKLGQQMAARPNVVVVALHPGIVKTEIVPFFMERFAEDTPELVGGTAVWLTTEEAKFMSGRFMSANWCVKELVERKEEIISEDLCKVGMTGKVGQQQFQQNKT